MHPLKTYAEKLRGEGYSYKLIEQKLGVSRSTMSLWFRDKPFKPNEEVLSRIKSNSSKVGLAKHKQRVKETKEQDLIGRREIGILSKRDLLLLGIGIYIGEGSKSAEIVRISNSDPAVIQLAIKWLLEACNLTPDNLSVRLHIYPDNDKDACLKYWMDVTGLSMDNFRNFTIDTRQSKSKAKIHKLPYGTAHITVKSNGDPKKGRFLFRKVQGWMNGALNKQ